MNKFSILVAAMLLIASGAAQAGEAGKVGYISGTLVAQRADGTLKVLAPKSEVLEGDMLITAKDSYAQVQMNDGAKMTLRPHSNLKIESFQFNKDAPQADNAVLRLIKGGFRALTGLIGKRGNPDAYSVRTTSATIGIRGTDFSSRLCFTKDCRDDETAAAKPVLKPQAAEQVVGRVMLIQGELSANEGSGKARKLLVGAPVYEGDALATGKGSYAIVAFRDESRVTLQANTVFQVEQFKYDKAGAQENAVLRLIKGGVRVITGLIGRVNRDNYQFKMSTATIGIRGTSFDAWCNGPCVDGAANVYVRVGEVMLVSPGGSFLVAIGQAATIARDTGKPVQILAIPPDVLDNKTPLPDSIPLDMKKLFDTEAETGEPGLYVTVFEGHVILVKGEEKLDLGRGETGFADREALRRLTVPPAFMSGDMQISSESGPPPNPNPILSPGGCTP
ncbi:MAG: FecR domain-containing protein [Nitrosomonadales bacterium]|nr:FecR domain-containing protein [Nitrosomonadales bacterium]